MSEERRVRDGLRSFDERGIFREEDYVALKRLVADVRLGQGELLDGFLGLFFERHVLDDVRRRELISMPDGELSRALRHRFRQVVAGANDSHQEWHALSAHVRDALATLSPQAGREFPASIRGKTGFSAIAVEQAIAALWCELGHKPTSAEATADLIGRYHEPAPAETASGCRDFPEVMRARLDAQRLARGILEVLADDEKELLRHALDGQSIDEWAKENGTSRATAYRMLSRIKSLCRVELDSRTSRTQLQILDLLREHL